MNNPIATVRTTPYGQASIAPDGSTTVTATQDELQDWARRPGAIWPCSTLARCNGVSAFFDARGDLVDIEHPGYNDVAGHEFSAWSSDVLKLAGFEDSPAIR